jgi:3',5'-cyclic-nucleotide phosphodiesterase
MTPALAGLLAGEIGLGGGTGQVHLQILGGHQVESAEGRATAFLIDGTIAIDAGGLTGGLTIAEQDRIDTILLTHHHFDHICDLPFVGLLALDGSRQIAVHCSQLVHDTLVQTILNGAVWLNLFRPIPGGPPAAFRHCRVAAGVPFAVKQYEVLPVENRHHPVPVIAYQLTSPEGRRVLYTGDTGPGIRDIWALVEPDVMLTEVTTPNTREAIARLAGHLTPALLEAELVAFRGQKGYLPRVVVCHVNQRGQAEVRREVGEVARRLQAPIEIAHEGMRIDL